MIREMEYICVINQEKNFTRAAERLMISQPALSATVKKAEEQLGAPIFDRSTKPISLTPAGEYYIHTAEQILGLVDDMNQHIENLAHLKTGKVVIGCSTFFCCYVLPPIIQQFKKQYPGIDIDVAEGSITDLRKKLVDESIDLLLCISGESDSEIMNFTNWKQEMLLLVVPEAKSINHKLFDQRLGYQDIMSRKHLLPECPRISILNFKQESFLRLPKGSDIYRRTIDICHQAGFTPNTTMSPEQMLTAYHLACANMGITFIREQFIPYTKETEQVFFYVIDSPLIHRNVCLAQKKNRILPAAVSEFYKFMQKHKESFPF